MTTAAVLDPAQLRAVQDLTEGSSTMVLVHQPGTWELEARTSAGVEVDLTGRHSLEEGKHC